jgi:hypothetical protein
MKSNPHTRRRILLPSVVGLALLASAPAAAQAQTGAGPGHLEVRVSGLVRLEAGDIPKRTIDETFLRLGPNARLVFDKGRRASGESPSPVTIRFWPAR